MDDTEKDALIENMFDAYAGGITPPQNATLRAKALAERGKKSLTARIAALTSAAAVATAACCTAVALSVTRGNGADGEAAHITYYTLEQCDVKRLDPYAAPDGLGFIDKLNIGANTAVTDMYSYELDGATAIIRADVRAVMGVFSHDAVIYVEYTDGNIIFEPLSSYADGDSRKYSGVEYKLSYSRENGEPVSMVLTERGGVRYYITVMSSDREAYKFYLELIG